MLIKTEKRKGKIDKFGKQHWQTWGLIRCEWCGKEKWYNTEAYKLEKRKFCSPACANKYSRKKTSQIKKKEKKCVHCEIPLNEKNWNKHFGEKCVYICRICEKKKKKGYYRDMKNGVIQKYGGKCACCGEDRTRFLTIDHVNGEGRKEIREDFSGDLYKFLRWLRDNPVLSKYQILCYNCNCGKRGYGICPHNIKKYEKEVISPIVKQRNGEYRWTLKMDVLSLFGEKCECCGEDNPYFLTIHHVNNDGAEEREQISGWGIYIRIRSEAVDLKKYCLLCYNCNCAKEYHGYCHEKNN